MTHRTMSEALPPCVCLCTMVCINVYVSVIRFQFLPIYRTPALKFSLMLVGGLSSLFYFTQYIQRPMLE